ncbi:hypothetical protein KOI35_37270 [Actinoplanes bogorensis]|uniref:Uncharacterized protein n=1 Tax=Paractinoplanes bogorensis TaxID=1610840 RepID=A0ABS5Z0F9_9ACTN|nr:hypothetical protein [Actinoplanes bogorensis]MBU2669179.1 hypothetical protein [Actinoplanes bogorensis]
MVDAPPWDEYSRDRPRPGMSYPIGRDRLERALHETGAAVRSLSYVSSEPVHPLPPEHDLIQVFWFGRSRGRRLANATLPPVDALWMRVWAVPSERRREIAEALPDVLPTVGEWIAAALRRDPGTVWSTADHRLTVRHGPGGLRVDED